MRGSRKARFYAGVIVLLVFTLIASYSVSGKSLENIAKQHEGTTINVLWHSTPSIMWIEDLLPRFEERYGIKVNMHMIPQAQLHEKSLLEMAKRTGRYDVYITDCMYLVEYAEPGYLEPIKKYVTDLDLTDSEVLSTWDYLPRAFSGTGGWRDVMYSLPIDAGHHMIACCRDCLKSKVGHVGSKIPVFLDRHPL